MSIDEAYVKYDSNWTRAPAVDSRVTTLLDRWRMPPAGFWRSRQPETGSSRKRNVRQFLIPLGLWPRGNGR